MCRATRTHNFIISRSPSFFLSLFVPFVVSMPVACFPFQPPFVPPPPPLPPPSRYRYHNNGIIAIPAAYFMMTLATTCGGLAAVTRADVLANRKPGISFASGPMRYSPRCFFHSGISVEAHSAINAFREGVYPHYELAIRATARGRAANFRDGASGWAAARAGAARAFAVYKQMPG